MDIEEVVGNHEEKRDEENKGAQRDCMLSQGQETYQSQNKGYEADYSKAIDGDGLRQDINTSK